jgi:DNA-binding response OmpR family regulator
MTRRVLVVDDELYIRNILDFALNSEGYEVITAADGEQALKKAVDLLPDLIILDVMMPKLDGFEVCRAIKGKDETKHISVILLTARDKEADRERGKQVNCDAYLTKPFSPNKLTEMVHQFLNRSSAV